MQGYRQPGHASTMQLGGSSAAYRSGMGRTIALTSYPPDARSCCGTGVTGTLQCAGQHTMEAGPSPRMFLGSLMLHAMYTVDAVKIPPRLRTNQGLHDLCSAQSACIAGTLAHSSASLKDQDAYSLLLSVGPAEAIDCSPCACHAHMCACACRQKVSGRRFNVQEPELDYEVESDEDWEEPDDAEVLTVRSVMLV